MRYNAITYKRLHSYGNYQNEEFSISIEVDNEHEVESAFREAREIVESEIEITLRNLQSWNDAYKSLKQLKAEIEALTFRYEQLGKAYERAKEIAASEGLNLDGNASSIEDDDLPF